MCGVTGYVDYASKVKKSIIQSMTDEINYRGPDSSGNFISRSENASLGIRRLSIIDLTTGDQPISNEDGTVTVVYNGEIYNYLELRRSLIKKGHKFKTNTDTEVLVHLYEDYGYGLATRLNGMFAFALWDEKKQTLLISRDPSGIKPLYYFYSGKKFCFGSEPKTILRNSIYKKKINQESIRLYSYLGYIPGEDSIFKGVKKLLPGHYAVFSKNALIIKKYFQPLVDDNLRGQSLEKILEKSVVDRTMSDVPWGVFLSGGLDSSLVAYYLAKNKNKLKTFSISFAEPSFDEVNYANLVAEKLGTEHHTEEFSSKDILDSFDEVSRKLDEPFADPSLFPTFKVSSFASKFVKVVLSGDGGDELFGGYPTYQGHLLAEQLGFMPKVLRDWVINLLSFLPNTYQNFAKKEVLISFFAGLGRPEVERHVFWMGLQPLGQKPLLRKVSFSKLEKLLREYDLESITKRMQLLDYFSYLRDDLLFKVDRASMYNSLEVRVPFLDKNVVNYAFSEKGHVSLFETKRVLRRLLMNKFPEIATRKKKGFGIPIAKWIVSDLRDLVETSLENEKIYNYFSKNKVMKLWDEHKKYEVNNAKTIWSLVIFSAWLKNWA